MDIRSDKAAYDDALKIASGKHDIVGLRLYDEREAELPNVGIIELKDAETGAKAWVDTASRRVRSEYASHWEKQNAVISSTLTRNRIDSVNVATDEDYVIALMRLFKMR